MLKVLLLVFGCFSIAHGLYAQVTVYRPVATYKGDIKELAKTIGKKYDEKKHSPAGDSSLLFKALIDQQPLNELQHIELVQGTKSAFSDFMLQGLRESGKSWRPMLQGGRGVKSYIWVYARLHSDGNITLFTGNQVSE